MMKFSTQSLWLVGLLTTGLVHAEDAGEAADAGDAGDASRGTDDGYSMKPDAARDGYAYPPDRAQAPAPQAKKGKVHSLILRAGPTMGRGYASISCKGYICANYEFVDANYKEAPGSYFSVEMLVNQSESFRLGGGLHLVPTTKMKFKDGRQFNLGTQSGLSFLLEPVLPLSEDKSLVFRGQFGLSLLWAGQVINDIAIENQEKCKTYKNSFSSCDAESSPFFGAEGALGMGFRFGTDVVWRVDLQAQVYFFHTLGVEVTNGSESFEMSENYQGVRGVLSAGIEL